MDHPPTGRQTLAGRPLVPSSPAASRRPGVDPVVRRRPSRPGKPLYGVDTSRDTDTTMALSDRIETASLTWMHWLAGALALLSGIVHLVLGIQFWGDPTSGPFVLAGLGFFGGVLLALMDYRRRLLYLVGVVFVAAQIVAFYFINYLNQPAFSTVEVVDKVAQVVLIVLLVGLYRQEGSASADGRPSGAPSSGDPR